MESRARVSTRALQQGQSKVKGEQGSGAEGLPLLSFPRDTRQAVLQTAAPSLPLHLHKARGDAGAQDGSQQPLSTEGCPNEHRGVCTPCPGSLLAPGSGALVPLDLISPPPKFPPSPMERAEVSAPAEAQGGSVCPEGMCQEDGKPPAFSETGSKVGNCLLNLVGPRSHCPSLVV